MNAGKPSFCHTGGEEKIGTPGSKVNSGKKTKPDKLLKLPNLKNVQLNPRFRSLGGFESLEDRIVLSGNPINADDLVETQIRDLQGRAQQVLENLNSNSGSSPEVAILANANPAKDGSSFDNAKELGLIQGSRARNGIVESGSKTDYYRFRVEAETDIRIRLFDLDADLELKLYNENRELIKWSLQTGPTNEFIRTDLTRGRYFVAVNAFDSRVDMDPQLGEYKLKVTGYDLRKDGGGDSIHKPTILGKLGSKSELKVSGWVGKTDRWDYYQYYINSFLNVRILMNQLSGNADLHIYNANHREIFSSTNNGRNLERISTDLSPGIYKIGIKGIHNNVYYSLSGVLDPSDNAGRLANVKYFGDRVHDVNLNAISAPEAWKAGHTGKDIVVAIVDTGVDFKHPELKNQMWINKGEIAGDGIDNDKNGYIDDVRGWSFDRNHGTPIDKNGHGTHIAGIIASANDRYGSTGIAHDAKIMAVRVLDENGNGEFKNLAKGIYYAVDNGANVINLSVGGEYNYAVRAAISYAHSKGVFVSVASGNEGLDTPLYPARHSESLTNVLSVGSHNSDDNKVWFSNGVGTTKTIQVDAPGVNVYSTLPDGRYGRYSGTSSSASYVSGLAALILSVNPDFSPNLVRHFITEGAVRNISNSDSIGGIDAARTLHLAREYNGNNDGSHFGTGNNSDNDSKNGNGTGGPSAQNYRHFASMLIGHQQDSANLAVQENLFYASTRLDQQNARFSWNPASQFNREDLSVDSMISSTISSAISGHVQVAQSGGPITAAGMTTYLNQNASSIGRHSFFETLGANEDGLVDQNRLMNLEALDQMLNEFLVEAIERQGTHSDPFEFAPDLDHV